MNKQASGDNRKNETPTDSQERKRPIQNFGPYRADRNTYIKVAVWDNQIEVDGREVTVYACTVQRSYKDEDGWHENRSFRSQELPVLVHALAKAHDWMLEQRNGDVPF